MKPNLAAAFLLLVSCTSAGAPMGGEDDAYALPPSDAEDAATGLVRTASPSGAGDGAVSAPAEVPAPDAPAPDAAAQARYVVYSATLRLVVVSARDAHRSIVAIAKEAGGWLQESDARSVTVRVPAAQFEAVLAKVEGLGEVADANVRAADVTEERIDLGIRLDNARKARERLLAHLERSEKVEDTIRIEAELARVTAEIERMEGRLRWLEAQIAMSTIRVELNSSQPQRHGGELDLPFAWVERLGDGLVAGTVRGEPRQPGFFSKGPAFEPPPGFVRYYRSKKLVEAMDAEGLRIKVQLHDNFDEGALAFWSPLARRALVQRRSLAVTEERELGGDRALLAGTREIGGDALGYLLVLVRTKDEVCAFEAWGPRDAFERSRAALLRSAESLDP